MTQKDLATAVNAKPQDVSFILPPRLPLIPSTPTLLCLVDVDFPVWGLTSRL